VISVIILFPGTGGLPPMVFILVPSCRITASISAIIFDILHTTVDQNGTMKGRINIVNLGVMLGYQFVFWKRFTLDMLLFGPSASYYSGNFAITGNLDPDQIKKP